MKVAIVVDDLIQHGGQEKLFEAVMEIWPEATIFTSATSKDWMKKLTKSGHLVVNSFIQKLPYISRLYRYYSSALVYQTAFERFDFSNYNLVFSISSRFAQNVITKPDTLHICYVNSPGRMIWETSEYFKKESYGWLRPLRFLATPFLTIPLQLMRIESFVASKRVDYFIANSNNVLKKIRKYFSREGVVINPFYDIDTNPKNKTEITNGYFLVITRLVSWKRVDIAIQACIELGLKLKVIGAGPDLPRLKNISEDNIEFITCTDEEKAQQILGCTALIQTQEEDFGIVPLEAMGLGKPVIAYGKGGVLETVVNGKTGTFFYEQSCDSLVSVLKKFNALDFNSTVCSSQAEKFSKKIFQNKIKAFVENTVNQVY